MEAPVEILEQNQLRRGPVERPACGFSIRKSRTLPPDAGYNNADFARRRRRRNNAGFSLIELLIAVTIIMIIMAIAIPSLGKLRKNANATAAEGNLKTLATVLNAYATEYPNVGYPPTLKALGPPTNGSPDSPNAASLIDAAMASAGTAAKQGYLYTYTPASGTPCSGYTIVATPQNGAGTRYFFVNQDGAIHFSDNTAASVSSPILQ